MNNWFTIDRIDQNTFAVSEYGHWLEPHSYLFIGSKKAALVDSGMGIGNIKEVVNKLTDKPVLAIATHAHVDHINGNKHFKETAVHWEDRKWMRDGFPGSRERMRAGLFEKPFRQELPEDFEIDKFNVYQGQPTLILKDGDIIDLGDRKLVVIHTPGHSPGHICLYEPETGYLATGDLLYQGRINASFGGTDPEALFKSLRKIKSLPKIGKILPAHHHLHVSNSILDEMLALLQKIREEGNLKHGTGIHKSENLSLLL